MYACGYFIPGLNNGNYLLLFGFIIPCPHSFNNLFLLLCYTGIFLKAYCPHSVVGAWRLQNGAFHELGVFPDLCRAQEAESLDQLSKVKPVGWKEDPEVAAGNELGPTSGRRLCCTCSSRPFLVISRASYFCPFPRCSHELEGDIWSFGGSHPLRHAPPLPSPSATPPPRHFQWLVLDLAPRPASETDEGRRLCSRSHHQAIFCLQGIFTEDMRVTGGVQMHVIPDE